jgi:hypothetical protein
MDGSTFWPGIRRVRPSQQNHPSYKGKSAPNCRGQGLDDIEESNNSRKVAFSKIKPDLLSNYYSILSNTTPPPCQVEEQENHKPPEHVNNVNKTAPLKQLIN